MLLPHLGLAISLIDWCDNFVQPLHAFPSITHSTDSAAAARAMEDGLMEARAHHRPSHRNKLFERGGELDLVSVGRLFVCVGEL